MLVTSPHPPKHSLMTPRWLTPRSFKEIITSKMVPQHPLGVPVCYWLPPPLHSLLAPCSLTLIGTQCFFKGGFLPLFLPFPFFFFLPGTSILVTPSPPNLFTIVPPLTHQWWWTSHTVLVTRHSQFPQLYSQHKYSTSYPPIDISSLQLCFLPPFLT